jgi:hypothetical protein
MANFLDIIHFCTCVAAWPLQPPQDRSMAELLYVSQLLMQLETQMFAEASRNPLKIIDLKLTNPKFQELLEAGVEKYHTLASICII